MSWEKSFCPIPAPISLPPLYPHGRSYVATVTLWLQRHFCLGPRVSLWAGISVSIYFVSILRRNTRTLWAVLCPLMQGETILEVCVVSNPDRPHRRIPCEIQLVLSNVVVWMIGFTIKVSWRRDALLRLNFHCCHSPPLC